MAQLRPTHLYGTLRKILINSDRSLGIITHTKDQGQLSFTGLVGDAHSGLTRLSCSRVKAQYPRGTPIKNTRQISIISDQELIEIAYRMGVEEIRPEWLGINLVFTGIPQLTQLPPSTRLIFDNGASMVVDLANGPCKAPHELIVQHYPQLQSSFMIAAKDKRGVTAWVEAEGIIHVGQRCHVHLPPQIPYIIDKR